MKLTVSTSRSAFFSFFGGGERVGRGKGDAQRDSERSNQTKSCTVDGAAPGVSKVR